MPDPVAFEAFRTLADKSPPEVAIVLGSGMGDVAIGLDRLAAIPFADVPGLGGTSVQGHRGRLSLGTWGGKTCLLFEGRLHFYEGHTWDEVTRPAELAHSLGAKALLLTNAAGGIRADLGPGSLMAIRDHVLGNYPFWWRDPGPGGIGGDRVSPYSPRLLAILERAAAKLGVDLRQGVYASVTGPCYETRAEIQALQTLGADAVGMSTAREIACGSALGLECAAVSLITNKACGLSGAPIHHGEVLVTAATQAARLAALIGEFVDLLQW